MTVRMRDIKALRREPISELLKWLGTAAAVALAWALGKWGK